MELNADVFLSLSFCATIIAIIFVGKICQWQADKEWKNYKDDGEPIKSEKNITEEIVDYAF